ncbi:hypothetical protein QCA50_011636 [Cerrena zonata]|uniref:Cytochrome P450 n=1 Tax=Cerrena zonata TaxID=2478898 RepID=A0AAW0FW26_9APHY
MQEVSRWHIVVPLGLPRISVEDDIYNGYHIPAGTVVFPNAYAISREVEDPECFIPERFLDTENPAQNPYEYMFGYGRRICPGRYLAENFLFLFAANTLAFFDIKEPSQDDLRNGLAHPADVKFSPTLVSLPENFTCRMEPRSQEHADIVASLTG